MSGGANFWAGFLFGGLAVGLFMNEEIKKIRQRKRIRARERLAQTLRRLDMYA